MRREKLNILSIDPGETTGIAMRTGETIFTWALTDEFQVYDIVLNYIQWDHVICERFAAVVISKHGLYTTELVGGVKALCWSKDINFTYRQPQHRKAYQEDAHKYLKTKQHVIHEEDALAHMYAWEAHLAKDPNLQTT